MGYSLRINYFSWDDFKKEAEEIRGKPMPATEYNNIQKMYPEGGMYTYQLKGKQYDQRGNHNSPVLPTLKLAVAVAYYNLVRLQQKNNKKL